MISGGSLAIARPFAAVIAVLALGLVLSQSLAAQLTTGTILGTVKDESGAVLPGAAIRIINVETGIARTAVAGSKGEYRVSNIPPGDYRVESELSGFQTAVRNGINISIGREAVVDFALTVGNVQQQVTVTGEASLVETTTASVSGLVDSNQMRDIPLNSRSFLELVPLQTGAVFTETGSTSSVNGFGERNYRWWASAGTRTAFCWTGRISAMRRDHPVAPPGRWRAWRPSASSGSSPTRTTLNTVTTPAA